MLVSTMIGILLIGFQAGDRVHKPWVAYTSRDGNFMVDLPKNPTKTFSRTSQSRAGRVKTIIAQCDTPDVLYTAEKLEIPLAAGLKPAEMEAILDLWRDILAREYNGKVIAEKKLRLDSGAYGKDFTIEGRPEANAGLSTIRVREYLSPKAFHILFASTAADRELPDDVGHFFASFSVGTSRKKKVGPHPEPTGKPLGNWGDLIDPDKDCKVLQQGKALVMSIPNTLHDLNADNDKLNSPRVVREVVGDFSVTVKIAGDFKPTLKLTNPKAVPYEAAGIYVWQDSDNYIFLGRASINRKGKISEFAAFEEREWALAPR